MPKKSILFIDDYETFRMLTRITLEAAGYEVSTAENGNDAIRRVQEQTFDLIILDLLMPQPDGFELYKKFQGLSVTPRTPVLILTCLGLEAQVQELTQQGAYLLKKDDASEQLVPKVRELIG